MEKSCQPQTEQMCNPPKKQPTQEKVHQVDREEVINQLFLTQTIQQLNHLQALLTVFVGADLWTSQEKCLHHDDKGNMHASTHPTPTYSG